MQFEYGHKDVSIQMKRFFLFIYQYGLKFNYTQNYLFLIKGFYTNEKI